MAHNPFEHETYKEILEGYLHKETIPYLEAAWREPWRHYHNIDHLNDLLETIEGYMNEGKIHLLDYHSLVLAAFFHDCYYNPRDNKVDEDESIRRFIASFTDQRPVMRNAIIEMIETTKHRKRPEPKLLRLFWEADNKGFYNGYDWLIESERCIRKEYVHVPKKLYKEKRIEFIKTNFGLFDSKVDKDLERLIEYINENY